MGAENSILKSYELGLPFEVKQNQGESASDKGTSADRNELDYIVCPAKHKEDGSTVSVFIYKKSTGSKTCLGSSCAEILKSIRHPFILKFIGVCESEKHMKLITEDVIPIDYCIHELELFEVIAGLHNVLEAIQFLHEKGGLVHRKLSLSSIFVSKQDGSWKLGGMEKVDKHCLSGVKEDIVGFAKLAVSVLDSQDSVSNVERTFTSKLENEFYSKEKIDAESLRQLLAEPIFRNRFLETTIFLNSVTMKNDFEKKEFFSGLAANLRTLNPETVAKKLLPKLLSKVMLAEPNAEELFIPHLLAFRAKDAANQHFIPIFPEAIFKKYCVPLLLKLFRSKQTHVRLVLLKYLSFFIDGIEKDVIESDILPLVLLGLRDENDAVVVATFHGLANLVPVLGGAVVVGAERGRFFVDQSPKFSVKGQCSALAGRSSDWHSDATSTAQASMPSHDRKQVVEQKREERRKQMEVRRQERERKKKEEVESEANQSQEIDLESDGAAKKPSEEKRVSFEADQSRKHEESEPDWEGFEAFSSGSVSDEDQGMGKLTHTLSAENLLMMSKGSLQIQNEVPAIRVDTKLSGPSRSPTNKPLILGQKKRAEDSEYRRSESLNSSASKDSDSISQPDYCHQTALGPAKTKVPDKITHSTITASTKRLGGEFDYQISVVKGSEPDFFADMTPDLSKSSTVLIEKKGPTVSTKFEAADVTDDIPSGWDDGEW